MILYKVCAVWLLKLPCVYVCKPIACMYVIVNIKNTYNSTEMIIVVCTDLWGKELHHYTHAYLSMQLLAWEVSADYYTHPPETVSLLMLTIRTYRQWPIHNLGSRTIQRLACTSYRFPSHDNQCSGAMKMGNIAPRLGFKLTPFFGHSRPSMLTITLPRLSGAITLTTPTYLCGSLPQRFILALL